MKHNVKFIYEPDSSMGTSESKNILIRGNNKEILPALVQEYGEKVKCVYIDPPYNNGDSYHYYNDNESEANWLRNIRNVLTYLRMLLTKDGSVWISIDDSEMAYLKIEADKIFGRENHAGTIIWQQRKTRENRAVFSNNHEYVLVYAKNIAKFKKSRNLLPVGPDFVNSKYKNPDNDPRGPWQSVSANVQAGHAVPSQFYTIVSPSGAEFNPPKGRCWVYNEERMKREIVEGNIWFGVNGNNTPRIKKFLSTAKIGLTPQTLWVGDEFGTTDSAKKHLLTLFPDKDKVFDTPKPEELVKQILEIATNEGDIVLDCYLGSGTTLATAHKMNRNYIGIEVGEQMTELVVNRLKKVIAGEQGGVSVALGWHGGGNFAYFSFDSTKEGREQVLDCNSVYKKTVYHQLDLFSLFDEYGEKPITDNGMVHEPVEIEYGKKQPCINTEKSVLVSLVKDDNKKQFLDGSATLYYTGKRFPTTVALNKLYYFMPYIKGKGVRDLYFIKIARLGYRKEGTPEENKNDLRLIFEVKFVKQLFDDYEPVALEIWRTFTDTTLGALLANNKMAVRNEHND